MLQDNSKIMDLPTLMKYISEQRARGLSDYKIVESLISNGYSSSQIYDALTQLDLKHSMKVPISGNRTNNNDQKRDKSVNQVQEISEQSQGREVKPVNTIQKGDNRLSKTQQVPPAGRDSGGDYEVQSQPVNQTNTLSQQVTTEQSSEISPELIEKVQEISETIIEEKWDELIANVKKIVNWKNRMEERINKISERMDVLEKEMSDLNNSIFSKIKEYDNHISDFSTDLKALQKVFGDMLPEFVSGIHQLKDIIEKSKKR